MQDIRQVWVDFQNKVISIGAEFLGYVEKKHKDSFDKNDGQISALIEQKNKVLTSLLSGNNSLHDLTCVKEVKKDI